MPEKVSADLEKGQIEALDRMQNDGGADSQSEAMRRCLNLGLSELGYLHGKPVDSDGNTHLRTVARRFADAFALVGLILVGFTFFYPLGLRAVAAFPFAASLGCYGIDRVLANYEPAVTRRLAALFGGEKA